jgi:hypothetical protein
LSNRKQRVVINNSNSQDTICQLVIVNIFINASLHYLSYNTNKWYWSIIFYITRGVLFEYRCYICKFPLSRKYTCIFLETLHQLLHQFTFLSIPSLQVCFHHMSYNQCFDVNSERKKEQITGNLIWINLANNKKLTTLSITRICKFLMAMKWISW